MRIVLVGGGSGGHITPLKYVAQAVKRKDPNAEIIYIGPQGDKFTDRLVKDDANFNSIETIVSGKFRRYNRGAMRELLDLETVIKNIIDMFKIAAGFLQSMLLLINLRPDVILSKGSSASVPFLLAAKVFSRAKIYTHDSDSVPGLAHRISAPFADINFVGHSADYPYAKEKVRVVGVPLNPLYRKEPQLSLEELGKQLDIKHEYILVLGGSLGAEVLNDFAKIFQLPGELELVLISGRDLELDERKHNLEFISDSQLYHSLVWHAKIVVSRAGATSLSELSVMKKACVVVPALHLSDQMANTKLINQSEAAACVVSDDAAAITASVTELLNDEKLQQKYSKNLYDFYLHDAAETIADTLVAKEK